MSLVSSLVWLWPIHVSLSVSPSRDDVLFRSYKQQLSSLRRVLRIVTTFKLEPSFPMLLESNHFREMHHYHYSEQRQPFYKFLMHTQLLESKLQGGMDHVSPPVASSHMQNGFLSYTRNTRDLAQIKVRALFCRGKKLKRASFMTWSVPASATTYQNL